MSADVLLGLPVVVLSHRGPVSFTADASGERAVHRGAGGLVSALTGLAAYLPEAVWVCVAPPGQDAAVAREAAGQLVRLDLGPPTRVLGDAEPAALPPAAAPAPIRVQKTLQSAPRCCATGQARFLTVPEVAGRARWSVLGRGAG